MSVRVVERAITGPDGGEMTVRVEENDIIRVAWFCGDSRRFSPDALRSAIANVDAMAEYPEIWQQQKDSHSSAFFARVEDGLFLADLSASETARGVPWEELKTACAKALRSIDKQNEPEPDDGPDDAPEATA